LERASATSSGTVLAATAGFTTSMNGVEAIRVIGSKSRRGSYGSFEYRLGFTAWVVEMSKSVYPSAGDFAATSVPMIVAAPLRLSTTTG
jgi:hypothetical protein